MKEMSYSELRKMSITNSPKLPNKVIIGDIVHQWVGIGWHENGKATEKDKEELFTIVEG